MKRSTFFEFLQRFRGFSLSFLGVGVGVSYAPPDPERPIIVQLFDELGDRRVLFDSGCGVHRREMIDSLRKMRGSITSSLERIGEHSKARPHLNDMRRACQQFDSFLEDHFDEDGHGGPQEDFYMAIGEMRGVVGRNLAALWQIYEINIETELKNVFPTESTTSQPGVAGDDSAAPRRP